MLEDRALNTWDSARFVTGMAKRLGVSDVLVVTDPLHCVRTVAAFERAGARGVGGAGVRQPDVARQLGAAGAVRQGAGSAGLVQDKVG